MSVCNTVVLLDLIPEIPVRKHMPIDLQRTGVSTMGLGSMPVEGYHDQLFLVAASL